MLEMSGDVGYWCVLFGTLVRVSVLSVMWLDLESLSDNQFTTMVVCL